MKEGHSLFGVRMEGGNERDPPWRRETLEGWMTAGGPASHSLSSPCHRGAVTSPQYSPESQTKRLSLSTCAVFAIAIAIHMLRTTTKRSL
jgi:hypothetical protein